MPPRPLSVHLMSDVPSVAHDVPPQKRKFVRGAYIEFHHLVITVAKEIMFIAAIVKPFQVPEHTSVFTISNPVSFDSLSFSVTPVLIPFVGVQL